MYVTFTTTPKFRIMTSFFLKMAENGPEIGHNLEFFVSKYHTYHVLFTIVSMKGVKVPKKALSLLNFPLDLRGGGKIQTTKFTRRSHVTSEKKFFHQNLAN